MVRPGDRRFYGPGLAGGVVSAIWIFWHRDADLPMPLLAAVMLAPYYALIGYWWARRTRIETAALMGAVTALTGFEIGIVLTAVQAAATDTAVQPAVWLLAGLLFSPTVVLVGAFGGLVGGALAHPASFIQTLRRSA